MKRDDHFFNQYTSLLFCEKCNININELQNDHNYFRYICFKFNFFIKHIQLPKIKISSIWEVVLIEFRILPHIEFLIRNAIMRLRNDWCYTVVCGNLNYEFIVEICSRISNNINIIKIEKDNLTPSDYSKYLSSLSFWRQLKGEKILIYQEDSIIFKNNIQDFIKYDYIGAPFPKNTNNTPNCVGNGGFSLRNRSKMIEIIQKISVENTIFNSSTKDYIKNTNLDFPPEDVYFSKNMQELNIGVVADWNTAFSFSMESIFNENSFGGHRFWISNDKWREHINKNYQYSLYEFNSDIKEYLKFNNMPEDYNKTVSIKNAFDIDVYFFSKINNFPYLHKYEIFKKIKQIGLNGLIYHPKQLLNIYPNIVFYKFLDDIYVLHELTIYTILDFKKLIYDLSYPELSKIIIKERYSLLDDRLDLLLLVFIGNEERGVNLLHKIIKYKSIEKCNVAFCFNSKELLYSEKIKNIIKNNFENYAIYISKNLGTDITSTMLMFDEIYKKHNFTHIIKLHTKSITEQYNDLTDYLLSKPLKQLLLLKNKSNCIGNDKYYMNLSEDIFNSDLKKKFANEIDNTKLFVIGTIFYCPKTVFMKVSNFLQKNFHSYLFNNLYENNCINKDNSPIHFLERMFGVIK